jgi:putative ABC transport system ATP-binding protein
VTVAAALEVEDVALEIGGVRILAGVSMTVRPGELVVLSGPSGSGKTTVLSVAGGLLRPDRGTARLGPGFAWKGDGDPHPDTAFVLQVFGLVSVLTARENVSVAMRARGVAPADADAAADEALARVGVADLGDRLVDELSGGQQQRVAVARGLVSRAALVLADEPTSELDEGNRDRVVAELRAEADRGAVVVIATHDPAVIERCDREYHLVDGAIVGEEAVGTGERTGGRLRG